MRKNRANDISALIEQDLCLNLTITAENRTTDRGRNLPAIVFFVEGD